MKLREAPPRETVATGSAAFARIRDEVYRVVARVPRGRFSTFGDIAAFLDVMPRHVAFLLAKLPPDVREVLPWHRVLSGEGQVPDKARVAAAAWHALLEGEGVLFVDGVATRRSGSP